VFVRSHLLFAMLMSKSRWVAKNGTLSLRVYGPACAFPAHRTEVQQRSPTAASPPHPERAVFGEVGVGRLAYRASGRANLHPADGRLNPPVEKHSHGLRRLAAIEATRGSFDDAVEAIERATGQQPGKRQVEDLAGRAAADFDAFYAQRRPPQGDPADVLALSCDGKGVVMRPDALRPATGKAAAKATPKLATRLSKAEKRHRKRMAEVGSVDDATPVPRAVAMSFPRIASRQFLDELEQG